MPNVSLFDLTDRKALVTGGAMGIGRMAAFALAEAGADVAIVDLNEEVGSKTAAAIREMGRDSLFVKCNVSKVEQIRKMIDAVVQRFGRLDIAVNNAGIYVHVPDEDQTKEEFDQVIGVNLTGTWLCARAEMQQMIRQRPTEGKIINVASISATTVTSTAAYDASKAGVVHMSRTLASRWGRYNINVNCVSPSYVIGGMGSKSRSLEERQKLRDLTPLGHVLRPEDLQGPILFLASRASDYVTGQNIIVDGGLTMGTWLQPHGRSVPPRVDPAEEVAELRKDLAARGIAHDENATILE